MTTEEQMAAVQKYLSEPLFFPEEFKKWLMDYVATNIPPLPIQQVLSFKLFLPHQVSITAAESTSSATATDLATVGPQVTGLSNGRYIVFHGCRMTTAVTAPMPVGFEALSLNGAAPNEDTGNRSDTTTNFIYTLMRGDVVRLMSNDNNSIKMQYKVVEQAKTVTFSQRWMLVMKIANA